VDGDKPLVVRNEDVIRFAGIAESEFSEVCDSELAEIERRRQRYLGSRERVEVAGRIAIVIDDGIATGATTRAALRATRMRKPKNLILAVPVAPEMAAVAWYRKAADQGDANAQFNVGVLYESGKGVQKDHAVAVTWYRKAADHGHAHAQCNLGIMYYRAPGLHGGRNVVWQVRGARRGHIAILSRRHVREWPRCSEGRYNCGDVVSQVC
jgi:hypothetical protein